ncbi:SWI/SNF-related matrix-associated actin-dependent regulator of chromatin subfamily A-like protein 1 [Halotydeus destructor]|nr:SWI/SNF-related matrix-associated actin-dependent regulator of chromatin subfamily A-like protein 1 [Halotydeus destructor]
MTGLLDVLPLRLASQLHDFQKETLRFAVERKGNIFIADETGLGKTVQALSVAFMYRPEPLLVICPAVLCLQWKREVEYWYDPYILKSDIGIVTGSGDYSRFTIVICSYTRLHHLKYVAGVVVVDESHFLKNGARVKRFEAVRRFTGPASHVILLSATPLTSRLISEVGNQISIFGMELQGKPTNMIQRWDMKAKLLGVIKKRYAIPVNLCGIDPGSGRSRNTEIARLKTVAFCDGEFLRTADRMVVFYTHNKVADEFKRRFECIHISGSTSLDDRESSIERFADSPSVKYLLLQIRVGGTGLNLSFCNRVLFLELDYNPTVLLQAEDRVYRIGQKEDCFCYYVITTDPALPDTASFSRLVGEKLDFIVDEAYGPSNQLGLGKVLLQPSTGTVCLE